MSTSRYAHGHHSSVLASHGRRGLADSAPHLLPHLAEGHHVLDVGSGPGSITLEMADAVGPRGSATGLDFSDTAVGVARAAAADRGTTNANFRVADVFDLAPGSDGLRRDGYDVVHAHQVLQHLTDPVAALLRMAAMVAPGGLLSLREVDYSATTWSPDSTGLRTWLRVLRGYMACEGQDADAGSRLRSWIEAAGLPAERVRISHSEQTWTTPEERARWGTSWHERALHSSFRDLAVRHGFLDRAGVESVARAFSDFAAAPPGHFTLRHTEAIIRFD